MQILCDITDMSFGSGLFFSVCVIAAIAIVIFIAWLIQQFR